MRPASRSRSTTAPVRCRPMRMGPGLGGPRGRDQRRPPQPGGARRGSARIARGASPSSRSSTTGRRPRRRVRRLTSPVPAPGCSVSASASSGWAVASNPVRSRPGGYRVVASVPDRDAARGPRSAMADTAERRGSPIRVLLAEDQSLVRGAMAALLSMEDDLVVVGAGRDRRGRRAGGAASASGRGCARHRDARARWARGGGGAADRGARAAGS